jgi:hypothetical protein
VTSELTDGGADEQERAAEGRRTGLPGRGSLTGAVPEDDAAGWPGSAAEPGSAVRHVPGKPRRWVGGRVIALVLALIVVGSLAAVALSRRSPSPAAVRAPAAAWVAEQVSPDVTVSCDAVMCAALRAHGFPAGELVVLGPASPDPVPSVLVVETANGPVFRAQVAFWRKCPLGLIRVSAC